MDAPCTCGHTAEQHNALGVCMAQTPDSGDPEREWLCPCPDFTSDDVAVAQAAGVLVAEVTRPDGTTRVEHVGIDE